MLLGARLRRHREAKGVSREEAGYSIRGSESKISRMELGRVGFKERDVSDLLTLYGVTDEGERAEMMALTRDANRPGWWHRYNDVLPSWFLNYIGLESAAVLIRTYEVQLIPGLLQTQAYARAVILLGYGEAGAQEIERRVNLRIERQRILCRVDPPQLGEARLQGLSADGYVDLDVGDGSVLHLALSHPLPLPTNVLLLRWDTKPDKRIRRTFLQRRPTRRTSFYAAVRLARVVTGGLRC